MNSNPPTHILSSGSREATADEAAVLEAMHALSQACLDASRPRLLALAEEGLTYSHSDGRIQTREAFIDALESSESVFRGIELSGVSVQLAGAVALVHHQARYSTVKQGQPGSLDVQVSQVWRRTDGAWRLLLRQARKMAVPL
ncbi:MAG: nuclear transport factor 2 family protein [Polaromonas sp.]|nr:nuclear transport factor 2 family protein [Polaromonas sp.]